MGLLLNSGVNIFLLTTKWTYQNDPPPLNNTL